MTFRAIGEFTGPLLARAKAMAGFQKMIGDLETPESRKKFILVARMGNLISNEETTLLLQVYQLETA